MDYQRHGIILRGRPKPCGSKVMTSFFNFRQLWPKSPPTREYPYSRLGLMSPQGLRIKNILYKINEMCHGQRIYACHPHLNLSSVFQETGSTLRDWPSYSRESLFD